MYSSAAAQLGISASGSSILNYFFTRMPISAFVPLLDCTGLYSAKKWSPLLSISPCDLTAYQASLNFVARPTRSLHNTTAQRHGPEIKPSLPIASPLLHNPSLPSCIRSRELSIMVSIISPLSFAVCLLRISACRWGRAARLTFAGRWERAKPWFVDDTPTGRTGLLAMCSI